MIDPKDPILYWNAVALEENRVTHSSTPAGPQAGPTMSSRALAIVHLAMHDAWFGPQSMRQYLPAGTLPPAPAVFNGAAAVAAAACTTLAMLYPHRRAVFEAAMTRAGIPAAGDDQSARYGRAVALEVLDRLMVAEGEPGAGDRGHAPSPARGCHRPDPDNPQGYHGPFYGTTTPLIAVTSLHTLDSPAGWLDPSDPNYVKDLAALPYTAALREVRTLGAASGSTRSADQTIQGLYWAYDGAKDLGTPPRLYNLVVRRVLETRAHLFSTDDTAQLFAMVNAAMGDAGVLAWAEKYRHDLWRPVLGVREHDPSVGPAGTGGTMPTPSAGDPFWLPLGAPRTNTVEKSFTPPFPAYPSGHATFGAAAFQILRLFVHWKVNGGPAPGNLPPDPQFVDDVAFEFVSEELDGRSTDQRGTVRPRHLRKFDSLWQAIFENGASRVFLGVHWVFDAFDADDVSTPTPGEYKPVHEITYQKMRVGGVPLGLRIADDIWTSQLKLSPVPPGGMPATLPASTAAAALGATPTPTPTSRRFVRRPTLESTNIR